MRPLAARLFTICCWNRYSTTSTGISRLDREDHTEEWTRRRRRDRPAAAQLWQQQKTYALIVGIISPVSYVLVLYAMQVAPLSHVAPAREVSMLFAALLGGHLLGEKDRGPRIAGAALIAAGVMALGMG